MSFTPAHLYFDDLRLGQEWESPGRTVTQADIVSFAGLSGDFNPVHIDHHYARTTLFGRPIAHGLLVLSIGSGLGLYNPPVRTLAFLGIREWNFKGPVFIDDTVRLKSRVVFLEARARGRRGVVTWHRALANQDGKVVQQGTTLTLVEARAAAPGPRPASQTGPTPSSPDATP